MKRVVVVAVILAGCSGDQPASSRQAALDTTRTACDYLAANPAGMRDAPQYEEIARLAEGAVPEVTRPAEELWDAFRDYRKTSKRTDAVRLRDAAERLNAACSVYGPTK